MERRSVVDIDHGMSVRGQKRSWSKRLDRDYTGQITQEGNYFGLESGGQSLRTSIGLPPLCTVGAAEFEPPASGKIALFSTAIEFDVFSSPLPAVAAGDVVQLVSGLSLDCADGCANRGPAINDPAKTAATRR
jgi:hypothetical protein